MDAWLGDESRRQGALIPIRVQSGSSVSAFAGGVVKVKELDWLKEDLCTGVCLCPLLQWLLCST